LSDLTTLLKQTSCYFTHLV